MDNRGDILQFFDGNSCSPNDRMLGPMDEIPVDGGNNLLPQGKKRPYFSSEKIMTLQMLTNDDGYETSGYQIAATAVKKGMVDFLPVLPSLPVCHFLPSNSALFAIIGNSAISAILHFVAFLPLHSFLPFFVILPFLPILPVLPVLPVVPILPGLPVC